MWSFGSQVSKTGGLASISPAQTYNEEKRTRHLRRFVQLRFHPVHLVPTCECLKWLDTSSPQPDHELIKEISCILMKGSWSSSSGHHTHLSFVQAPNRSDYRTGTQDKHDQLKHTWWIRSVRKEISPNLTGFQTYRWSLHWSSSIIFNLSLLL